MNFVLISFNMVAMSIAGNKKTQLFQAIPIKRSEHIDPIYPINPIKRSALIYSIPAALGRVVLRTTTSLPRRQRIMNRNATLLLLIFT